MFWRSTGIRPRSRPRRVTNLASHCQRLQAMSAMEVVEALTNPGRHTNCNAQRFQRTSAELLSDENIWHSTTQLNAKLHIYRPFCCQYNFSTVARDGPQWSPIRPNQETGHFQYVVPQEDSLHFYLMSTVS